MALEFNLVSFNTTPYFTYSTEMTVHNAIVSFDDKSIEDYVSGIKIIDVIIGAATIHTSANDRIVHAGADYLRRRHGTRRITINAEVPLSKSDYANNVRKLRAWAESEEPKALRLPVYVDSQIYCILTGFSEFSLKGWWLPIELEFTAFYPYFEKIEESSSQINSNIVVGGNGEPSLRIVHDITDPLVDPEWKFDDGKKIRLNGTYTSGQIVIDLNRLMVYHDGISIMKNLAPTSRFTEVKPGKYLIKGPTASTLNWKERWL